MTNWELLLGDTKSQQLMVNFANGESSVKNVETSIAFTPLAGEFRSLVRSRGADEARRLARKALSRRQLV